MKIEVIKIQDLPRFSPQDNLTYVFLEGDDLEDLTDPSGGCYPEGSAMCGSGYRIRSDKFIPVDSGGWVELVDLKAGVMVSGKLLNKTICRIPKGIDPSVWVSAWLRHKCIGVYRAAGTHAQGTLPPRPPTTLLEQFRTCLVQLGYNPKMSILTPTFNRHSFLPRLMECVRAQETKARYEWCILDDSPEPLSPDLLRTLRERSGVSTYYVWLPAKIPIGNKRNILSSMAAGGACVNFDDDDFHHPERIKHSLFRMDQKKAQLVGSSRCLLYLKGVIYQLRGFGPNHSTGGLMAFTREYARSHTFGEDIPNAEESEFTNTFQNPMSQLDPNKVILIMSHSRNTYDKTSYVARSLGKTLDATKLRIANYTGNKKLRRLFEDAFRAEDPAAKGKP